jgi:hypothetical protein
MLRGAIGTPIRRIDLENNGYDEAALEALGNGGDIGYNNRQHESNRSADAIWFGPKYCGGSDYSGSYVEKANYKVLVEECQRLTDAPDVCPLPWWFETSGDHSTFGIILHAERTPDEIAEMLAKLDDYPLLDEEAESELEQEGIEEAWDNWARSDYERALEKAWGAEIDFSEVENLREHFENNAQSANEYWQDDGGSMYIDVEKVAEEAFTDGDLPEGAVAEADEPQEDGEPSSSEPPAGAPGGYDIELNGLGGAADANLPGVVPDYAEHFYERALKQDWFEEVDWDGDLVSIFDVRPDEVARWPELEGFEEVAFWLDADEVWSEALPDQARYQGSFDRRLAKRH